MMKNEMKNTLEIMNTNEAMDANGGAYCKVCGYSSGTVNVARHILRRHFGIFAAVYASNIWRYRRYLAWSLGL